MSLSHKNFEGCIKRYVVCDEHGEIQTPMIYRYDLSKVVQVHRKMHHNCQKDVKKVRIIEEHVVVTPKTEIIIPFPENGYD